MTEDDTVCVYSDALGAKNSFICNVIVTFLDEVQSKLIPMKINSKNM